MSDADWQRVFVRSVRESLGGGIDLPLTAEGIENPAILDKLRTMGKLKGQGYLYGRPESAAAVRERLAEDLDAPGALAAVDAWVDAAEAAEGADGAGTGVEGAPDLVARTIDALLGVRL